MSAGIPTERRIRSRPTAWRIAGTYGVVALLWIYFSDRALGLLVTDREILVRWSVVKGFVFVGLTTLLLGLVMRRALAAVERGYAAARRHETELAARAEAERTLRTERNFSEAMLNSLPGVLYLYEQSGRFLRWNANFERVTGYNAAEIAQMHPLDLFSAEEREKVGARIAEVFERGESSVEAGFMAKGGTITPYYFTGVKTEFDGRPCLIGMGIDIRQRMQAEAARQTSEARYRALFEYAPDGILIGDSDSNFLDANVSMCRMLGYTRDELVGLHASDIISPQQSTEINPVIRDLKARASHHGEWIFRRKDGTLFPAEVIATLLPDGNLLGLVRDITERKRIEGALLELNANLESKVTARTEELQAALVRAEAADQVKSAFLATMSHELRTPLNSIIGFTGIVLQGLAGPLNAEQTKQLGMVRSSARHLLELINDVLDISKIEAGQLEVRIEAFDLPAAIARVVASMRPMADKKSLMLEIDVAPGLAEMSNDRRRVEQVLLNLLNNAIKFTARGRVRLSVDLVAEFQREPNAKPVAAVRFRVTDTGIGMLPEDLGKLFQPFRQIETGLARSHEGTGLGLAICRRLAELMGGTISVASKWREGSVFTVTLPLEKPLDP